jgi:hypothetical protein
MLNPIQTETRAGSVGSETPQWLSCAPSVEQEQPRRMMD